MITQTYPAPETSKKSVWSIILKVIIAVATQSPEHSDYKPARCSSLKLALTLHIPLYI